MNTTGKRLALCSLFLTMATLWWGWSSYQPAYAQNTGSLETECVAVASLDTTIVPPNLTAQEWCKALVAMVGNEWMKAVELRAVIAVADDLAVRMAAAESAIAALQAQSSATLQPQIDAINTKLANAAVALQ
jgi:hypothetical protein